MKHILPILTAALALTAATASAAESPIPYYEDYILPAQKNNGKVFFTPQNHTISLESKVDTYQDYNVIRTNLPDNGFGHDTTYRIQFTGDNVAFYLTDYIDVGDLGSSTNVDALTDKGIKQIGYRYLESNDASKKGTTDIHDIVASKTPAEQYLFGKDKNNNNKTAIVDETKKDNYDNIHTITRNQYYLGTFNEGDVIELYMSREENGKGVWSTSTLYTGGYGEGVTDATDQLAVFLEGSWNAAREAMPLASLTPDGGSRVFFGIKTGPAVGSPLPGGLQIALIAGLFGLGFWYVRRRKAIAA